METKVTRDKEGYYVAIKGSIHYEDVTVISGYTPNIGAPRHMKQVLADLNREVTMQ